MWAEKVLALPYCPARCGADARGRGPTRAADAQVRGRGRRPSRGRRRHRPGACPDRGVAEARADRARGRRRHPRRDPRRGARPGRLRDRRRRPQQRAPHHDVSDRRSSPANRWSSTSAAPTPPGYCSDETRTYVVGGEPEEEFRRYYAVLQRAQQAACAHVRPGVPAESVDAAARDVIADAGYGDASSTAPDTASAWRGTRTPTSSRATPSRWSREWRSRSSPASTSKAGMAPASRTSWSCTETGHEPLNLRPHDLGPVGG